MRSNQQNSRRRKQSRLQDLERNLRNFELQGPQASVELQKVSRCLKRENEVLREIIRDFGISEDDISQLVSGRLASLTSSTAIAPKQAKDAEQSAESCSSEHLSPLYSQIDEDHGPSGLRLLAETATPNQKSINSHGSFDISANKTIDGNVALANIETSPFCKRNNSRCCNLSCADQEAQRFCRLLCSFRPAFIIQNQRKEHVAFYTCSECYERVKVLMGKRASLEAIAAKLARGLHCDDSVESCGCRFERSAVEDVVAELAVM